MLNIEHAITEEELNDDVFWRQYKKDIEKAKEDFIASGKIGGNPYGFPLDMQRSEAFEIKKNIR